MIQRRIRVDTRRSISLRRGFLAWEIRTIGR